MAAGLEAPACGAALLNAAEVASQTEFGVSKQVNGTTRRVAQPNRQAKTAPRDAHRAEVVEVADMFKT